MRPDDLFSPEFERDPYSFYAMLRREYPIFLHQPTGYYILSRYVDVERAFKDLDFSTRNYITHMEPIHGGRMLGSMSGKEHSAYRNMLAPSLRARELREQSLDCIAATARELIDGFRGKGEVELVGEFASHFPIRVLSRLFGLPDADRPHFYRWYQALIAYFGNVLGDPEIAAAGFRARDEIGAYILPIIKERRARPGSDLLSTLCTAEVDGIRMTDIEVRALFSALLLAGGETTAKLLSSLFKNLLEHPDQFARVQADPSLIDRACVETLRYSPPAHILMRMSDTQVNFHGRDIPADATFLCLIGSANRDEQRFKDPDSFNIFREDLDAARAFTGNANHLAFGAGRHFCVGAMLTKVELEVAVPELLKAMPEVHLADGATPSERGLFLRAPSALHLRFTP